MHALVYFCAQVYVSNQERASLVVVGGLGGGFAAPPAGGDPFSFDFNPEQDLGGYDAAPNGAQVKPASKHPHVSTEV
jgi:hypothetical protein